MPLTKEDKIAAEAVFEKVTEKIFQNDYSGYTSGITTRRLSASRTDHALKIQATYKNCLSTPIAVLCSNYSPRNISNIPAVRIFACPSYIGALGSKSNF